MMTFTRITATYTKGLSLLMGLMNELQYIEKNELSILVLVEADELTWPDQFLQSGISA